MPKIELVIFDWNGTLQNDVPLYYEYSVRRVFEQRGLPVPTLQEYRDEVSVDLERFYRDHGVLGPFDVDALFTESRLAIKADGARTEIFPEVPQVLKALRAVGVARTLVSLAPTGELIAMLDGYGIGWDFAIVSGDVYVKAGMFREHCAMVGIPLEGAVVVGDMVDDARSATLAGIKPILCPRGYHTRERIEAARAEIPQIEIVATLDELPSLVAG